MAFPDFGFFSPVACIRFSSGQTLPRIFGFALMLLMTAGNFCLAQTVQPAVKQISTQLRGFGVPFNINVDESEFIEVQLFVTKDQGKSWQYYDRQATDGEEFAFRADEDGEYWFALKTLNRDKQLLPTGETRPELKVIVDTVKPTLQFNIDSDPAGRIVCSWDARDKNISPASLKILYRPNDALPTVNSSAVSGWKQVPIQLAANTPGGIFRDKIAWWPESGARSFDVRIEIADSAGNAVFQDSQVNVPLVAWRNQPRATAHAENWAARKSQLQLPQVQTPPRYIQNQFAANQQHDQMGVNQKMICEGGVCRPLPATQQVVHADKNVQLVGSQIEYADPPVPDGVATSSPGESAGQTSLNQMQRSPVMPKSIPWSGTIENPVGQQALAFASTQKSQQDSIDWGRQNINSPSSEYQIRSLPPITRDSNAQSTKELPGGMVVTESTATRQRSNQPMAEFRANTQPDWEGRGEAGLASQNQTDFLASSVTKNPSWQNERFVPPIPGLPSNDYAQRSIPNRPQQLNPTPPNQPVAFGTYKTAPLASSLDGPSVISTQHVNSRRFNLTYSVDAIDPSGVERVVLWMTRDGGQSWKSWATDPDSASPFPVEVDEPGVYGFRIVVHSRDGLTGLAPKRGDKADMWINVDTQAPLAKITSVPYGRGNEAGRLVINWQAEDPLLTLRPITLSYSASLQGPWTPIEHGLRNTGRYVWKVGTQVPEKIFVKLEAADQAGNVGVYQLKNLIDISGLVPRGRIQSVQPLTN